MAYTYHMTNDHQERIMRDSEARSTITSLSHSIEILLANGDDAKAREGASLAAKKARARLTADPKTASEAEVTGIVIHVGSRVTFKSRAGKVIQGIVTRKNRKSYTIQPVDESADPANPSRYWRVHPSFLRLAS